MTSRNIRNYKAPTRSKSHFDTFVVEPNFTLEFPAMTWTGGCLCGAVRFEVQGPPDQVGICHCRRCQRWTGSAFAVGVRFPRAAFRLTKGDPRLYRSSTIMERGFCADCGSPLIEYVNTENDVDGVWLSLGNFDDPSAFDPRHLSLIHI